MGIADDQADPTEAALLGQPWTEATIETARAAFATDYAPISDMRASADYRLDVARNLLSRVWWDSQGGAVSALEVMP